MEAYIILSLSAGVVIWFCFKALNSTTLNEPRNQIKSEASPWKVEVKKPKPIEVPLPSKIILNEEIHNIKLEREAGNFDAVEDSLRKPGEE
jgi:hypothetical protein